MKKIFTLILGLNFCFAYSQKNQDPIVMTIADIEVPLSEFLFLAQKDNGVDLLNKKSLVNYIELFKTFKLKVADAKSLQIQESIRFKEELSTYKAQLISSFLVDNESEEQVVRKIYERGKELLSLSHIIFLLPERSLSKDTLEVFNKANEIYKRIKAGEDFTTVGKVLNEDENSGIVYEDIDYVLPLQAFREIEETIYSMSVDEISTPVRTPLGFHIIRLNRRIANTARIQVAHILIQAPETNEPIEDAALLKIANEVYEKAKKGEDFSELAKEYSCDENTRYNGGILPFFGLGNMVLPFEEAAFALNNIGDVSEPVKTRFGYHIIKLLEKRGYPSFEEMKEPIYATMKQGDWNHELVKAFDERQKEKMGYTLNQEAYNELEKLCDNYFPADTAFYNRVSEMQKTLMQMNGIDFPQYEFAEYVRLRPASTKTYSGDELKEQYTLFVREILTELTKRSLDNNPDFVNLMNEYHDGILLFEVSNTKVWEKPLEEQEQLEQAWMKDLNQKYKVTLNRKVLNNLKKYLK